LRVRYRPRDEAPGRGVPADLTTRLRVVQSAYADAQHDLDLILLRPTLFDAADPVTAALEHALQAGARLPSDRGALLVSWAAEATVADLEAAWRRARDEAGRVGLSRLRLQDRRRVRRARRLLQKACSDRGSVPLRQGYFHRAEGLLSGLVALPGPVRAEILAAVRRPARIEGVIGDGGTGPAM
jgi:hypothetical protein